jgi:multidrug efflux system outer membrane protein
VGAPVPEDILPSSLAAAARLGEISAGMPSEVLLRRPDILMAEHRLKGAQANIGAARAAFFPRIALTAAGGITSGDLGELFKPGAGTWNFMPQVSLPIFDSGSRRAQYDAAGFDRDIAVAEYEKAIQTAFREVSDALSRRGSLLAQQRALESLVRTLEETHRLSEARYESGIDGYLGSWCAARTLRRRQQLVSLRLARWSNSSTLTSFGGRGLNRGFLVVYERRGVRRRKSLWNGSGHF